MTRRNRAPGSLSNANPLWSKAPLLLLRYPGLFVSIAVGGLLLALAAAAYPLFISSSASELVKARIDDPTYTRWAVGVSYRIGAISLPGEGPKPNALEQTGEAFESLTGSDPYLAPPVTSLIGPLTPIAVAGREHDSRDIRLFTGDQAIENVEILAGAPGSGALVPDLVADALGIEPGDEVVVGASAGRSTRIHVDGVFRSLYRGDISGFWRPWNDALVLYCSNCAPPPQPVILGRDAFMSVARQIGLDHVGLALQAPLDRDLTLQEAEDASRRANEITDAMGDRDTRIGRLFTRCYLIGFCGTHVQASFGSSMGEVTQQVRGRIAAVEGPAKLLRAAGVLVALAVVAGAGAFAMATRRVESALLFARGARPVAVGVRAALEALVPSALGAAAGMGLAFVLLGAIGPDGAVAQDASTEAVRVGLVSGPVAAAAIAVVSSASFLRQSEHHRTRLGFVAALPWELALVALALLVLDRLRSGGAVVVDEALRTKTPSLLLFVFPVLFLTGFVGLTARAIVLALRWARGRSGGLPAAPYLAAHRLASRPRLTMLMVTASGLCLGLFVQAQTVARSMETTVNAKAGVYVGSDVQVRIDHVYESPTDFPLPFTRAVREIQAGQFREGVPFDLLAIDPSTFTRAAFWDPAFASQPLEDLVERLRAPSSARLPVILSAWDGADPPSITLNTRVLPIEVVARTIAFPGMTSLRALVVVDQQRLVEAFEGLANPLNLPSSSHELWIRGETSAALAAIPELPYVPGLVITADEVRDIPYIAAVIDSFIVMNGLGLLAALLVFAAILMYLQTRQRSEIVSYGLSLRMGMRSARHLAAIAVEVAAMLIVSFVSGTVLAIVAARFLVPLLDPLDAIPPEPFTVVPVMLIAFAAPLLLLGSVTGGWVTERRARRADLGQVMRLAD